MSQKVAKNKIYFFYPFYFNADKRTDVHKKLILPLKELTLGDVLVELKLPTPLHKQINKKPDNLHTSVWKESKFKVSPDLYPHIRKIFNETEQVNNDIFTAYSALQINDDAKLKTLFQGAWGGQVGKGLEVKLSKSSVARLGFKSKNDVWSPFTIHAISVQLFGTGVGIVNIELEILPDSIFNPLDDTKIVLSSQIIETTNHLVRLKSKAPDIRWVETEENHSTFKLEDIIHTIVPFLNKNQEVCQNSVSNRAFSYTTVELIDAIKSDEEKIELAYRFAVHHTGDYLPEQAEIKKTIYQPFKNITHVMSIMGGALLIDSIKVNERKVSFLENYLNSTIPTVYWPLTLLAYQEYQMLIKLSQDTYLPVDFHQLRPENLSKLEAFQMKFLDFRLNYRFSHASKISMHNTAYNMWRDAFSLNKILDELKNDVNEISNYLELKLKEKENRRIKRVNKNMSVAGVFFGVVIAITSSTGMSFKSLDKIDIFSEAFFMTVGVSILIASLFAIIYKNFIRDK